MNLHHILCEVWTFLHRNYLDDLEVFWGQCNEYSANKSVAQMLQNCSEIKTTLTVFFYWKGVVHPNYTPPGQTINKEYYLNVFCQLRDAILWKWPQLWATGDWQLHHNNAPAHASHLMQSFLAKHQTTQVTQPPYIPELVPRDFWLFPKLKSPLKGKRYQTINEIQENMMGQLMAISTKDIAESFEQWERHWENCVRSKGAFFEGDCGIIVLCTMFLASCIAHVPHGWILACKCMCVFMVTKNVINVHTLRLCFFQWQHVALPSSL